MPGTNKWDNEAEQALLFAMILGKDEGEKLRYNWPAVHEFMSKCGMTFTKDAISQHFTKFMLKDFKMKYPEVNSASTKNGETSPSKDVVPATPKRATPAKGTPASRKRGKKVIKEEDACDGEEDGGATKNGLPLATPTKKAKTKASNDDPEIKTEVKREEEPEVAEDMTMEEA